ncbi:hypothetical protein GCM10010411_50080 [Actinomadura fulvescens]|uniref:Uncharacterized protein n=1 Tax=Actinomadura fulvescens TaxID=46160 RepID=A0ABP6CGV5_9ACTN
MATYVVRLGAAITPGTVADAQIGDLVRVYFDATRRPDWAPFARALTTAYARGAELDFLLSDSNPRDHTL